MPKKWKDISPDDFEYDRKQDTSVHAVILQESGEYKFDVWREELRLFLDVNRRILILDTAGLKYKNLEIPYIGYDYFEEFGQFQAFIYKMENGKIKKKKFKTKYTETDKADKINYVRRIKFPDIEPGTIIEYRYTLTSLDVVEPREWFFQHDIPTLHSYLSINLPEFITYRFKSIGNHSKIKAKNEESSINLNYIFHYKDPIPTGQSYRNRSFTTNISLYFQSTLYSFQGKNIPAFKKEDFMDCSCNYRSGFRLNLFRIDQKTGLISYLDRLAWAHLTKRMYLSATNSNEILTKSEIDFSTAPAGFVVFYLNDWESVDNRLNKNMNFGMQMIKAIPFKPIFREILSENDSDMQKMMKIYNYVNDEYNWNQKYSIYTSDNLSEILQLKKGNSADLNLLLVLLLKKAELEAEPVLVRTVDKGHIDKELAIASQFNNVVAMVTIDGQKIFLDAKDDNPWYALDKNNLNGQGRVVKKLNSYFVDVKNFPLSKISHKISVIFGQKDKLKYNVQTQAYGYFAQKATFNNEYLEKEFFKKNELSGFEINKKEVNELEGKVEFESILETNDNVISLAKIFDFRTPFLNPQRFYPIYLTYPHKEFYELEVEIPEGKKVEKKPINYKKTLNGASFISNIKIENEILKWEVEISIDKPFFESSDYNLLRDLYFDIEKYTAQEIIIK